MIRYSCCERRIGNSLAPCICMGEYCSRCLLCESHCECSDEAKPLGDQPHIVNMANPPNDPNPSAA